ncbi:hypothetical protein N7492_008336 [Penicillium capsulatum]|uniref:RNA polymerase II subunit A C-terminal domain phosphatase n=1 Tax=Penicillium capsulatum TaxID=69766 RepID=A0A9W9LGU4_9EURO|nr:hypothetical protein N7492_008336 [Penicillium capsulatum]KAJ6105739.1 hypothetical protein N7512_009256 [Penicillium capsulatum]
MLLRLPPSLHYPITVTQLLKSPGDAVERDEALFWYFYYTEVEEGDGLGNRVQVERKFPTRFESPTDGEVIEWKIAKGDVIEGPVDVIEIDEPCAHEVQFGGLCAECGKDMTESTYNTEVMDSSRAPIHMAHDNTTLTVSAKEATRVEEDAMRRLLASRRLSLVVDLDQTIIHATVDPTVREWKDDKDNPNYEALKNVREFQLVDDGPGMRGCWYYIKLRPGLEEFLRKIAELYELHIYTMGTRAYAEKIANIVDPNHTLFGDRILSRDESGSLTAKNLQRLFPVDTKMVVIIDDRGDVWRWIPNLIKVSPYDFFVGIGDINSDFLPKKQEIGATSKEAPKVVEPKEPKPEEQANGSTTNAEEGKEVSALEQMVTMGGGDDPRLRKEQTNAQEETIMHQVEDRPLLQKQKELDAEDDASAESSESSTLDDSQEIRQRHHLLEDHDRELYELQNRLEQVHLMFFEEYDKRRSRAVGGRVAALRGEKGPSKDKDVDLKLTPDISDIMPHLKRPILGGIVVVFSGVLPQTQDQHTSDIGLWAKSFGVVLADRISIRTTHLVAGRNRTAKVREATRYPNIKIVTTQWLVDSLTSWQHLDEEPYLLPVHPEDQGELITPGETEEEGINDEALQNELFDMAGFNNLTHLGLDANAQAAAEKELREFMGDDWDSDSESDADWSSEEPSIANKKRKRGQDTDGASDEDTAEDEEGDTDQQGSRLSQRIKRSYERSTGLREVAIPGGQEESLSERPQPEPTDSDAEKAGTRSDNDTYPEDPDDDEDELEREMLAAFEDDDDEPGAKDEAVVENE